MAKTNAQIMAEYDAKSPLAKLGIAAKDIASIAGNALSFGGANRFAQWMTGASDQQVADYEREQRVRAGLAGDVANVGGMVYGGKGVLNLARGGINAVRAAPAAVELASTAGPATALRYLTGTAGPGLVPAAAPVSRMALAKGAGILGLLGLSAAGRQEDTPAAAAKPAPATTTAAVNEALTSTPAAAPVTAQDRALSAINSILSRPHTLQEFQAATGALPGVAAVSTKQTNRDKVFGAASGIADTLYQAELEQAGKLTGDAKDQAVLQATENYRRNLLETLGVDPSKQALAALMAQAGAGAEE